MYEQEGKTRKTKKRRTIEGPTNHKTMRKSSTKARLQTHAAEAEYYECDQCDKKFGRKSTLQNHLMKIHHSAGKAHPNNKLAPHACHICTELTAEESSNSLDLEVVADKKIKDTAGEIPFECNICKMKLKCLSTLKTHMAKVHSKHGAEQEKGLERKLKQSKKCPVCRKVVVCLNQHMVTHSGSRSSSSSSSSSDSSGSSRSSGSDKKRPKKRVSTSDNKTTTKTEGKPEDEKIKEGEKGADVKDRSGNNKENRRSRSTSPRRRRRGDRSPTPKPLRIHIGRLTRNVTKDHLAEIFAAYGTVKAVEMSKERAGFNHLHRGFAYVEYSTAEEAETAMKHMDGGQIDGQEITAAPVLLPKSRPPPPRRNSPPRGRRWMGAGGGGRSPPPRFRRRPSPPRRRSPPRRDRDRRPPPSSARSRSRSRSPAPRRAGNNRRYSRSSSSSSR